MRDRARASTSSSGGSSRSSPSPRSSRVADDELPDFLVYRPEPKARAWRLFRTDRGFRVVGTPPSEEELERALRAAGARNGAEVEVGEESFELALELAGTLRRRVRPAARRPRRARPHGEGGARARPRARPRRRRPRAQADRDARRRRASSWRGRRSRTTRSSSTSTRARSTCCAPTPSGTTRSSSSAPTSSSTSPRWKEPDEVLRRARLGVATRPGYPRERLDETLGRPRARRSACSSSSSSRIRSPRASCAPPSRAATTSTGDPAGRPPDRRARRPLRRSRATLRALDVDRTGTPHRGARTGQARERRRHPRHAARVLVHRLLRRVHREQPAADEGDLGRGARADEEGARPAAALGRRASPRRPGSSPTTSTSCCTCSRRRRASSTGSRTSGATCPRRRPKRPPPEERYPARAASDFEFAARLPELTAGP